MEYLTTYRSSARRFQQTLVTYHVAIVLFMLGQTRFLLCGGEARCQVIDAVYTNQCCDHDRYYDDDYYHNQSYGNITHSLSQVSSTRTFKIENETI